MAPDIISAAGQAVIGYRITYPDVSPEAMGAGYPKLVKEYTRDLRRAADLGLSRQRL